MTPHQMKRNAPALPPPVLATFNYRAELTSRMAHRS
jgi:hypothetical protein